MTVAAKKSDAKSTAFRLLTIKDRSKQELKERLERNHLASEVEETIAYLEDLGYLDDLRYAQNYVEYRNQQRPRGNYLLRLELNRKGIHDHYIEQVLNPPELEYELAYSLAEKRLGGLAKVDALARRRRLFGLLQRRGFSSSVAKRVVSELLDRDSENEYN